MSKQQHDTNIKVCCRLRPVNKVELESAGKDCVQFNNTTIRLKIPDDPENYTFAFDAIFGPSSSQQEIFEIAAQPVIEGVLQGYNGTIFAYGQTGSGKTHTMEGPDGGREDCQQKGIIPRMMSALFQGMLEAPQNLEFQVKVSFLEIYMERIHDLLDPSKYNLMIKEDKTRGIYIKDSTELYVDSVNQMMESMRTGGRNRSIAATRMNERSSRSHSIFIVTLFQKDTATQATKLSKLYFIDLAGSEKVGKTNASGQQLEEAKMINKSLSALGNVINALTESKSGFVPYRDSKLTRILQESLGGNSKTTLVICASMNSYNARETLSTLRFGARAKNIKNKPIINQERSVKELEGLLDKSNTQIKTLTAIIKKASTFCQKQLDKKFYQQFESIISGTNSQKQEAKTKEKQEEELEQQIEAQNELQEQVETSALTIINLNNQLKEEKEQLQKTIQEKEEIENELKQRNQEIAEMNQRLLALQENNQYALQKQNEEFECQVRMNTEESYPQYKPQHRNRLSLNQSEISSFFLNQEENIEEFENPSFISTVTRAQTDKLSIDLTNQVQSMNPSFVSQESQNPSFLSPQQPNHKRNPSSMSQQDNEQISKQIETSFQESEEEKINEGVKIEELNNLVESQKQVIQDFTKQNIILTEKIEQLVQEFNQNKEQQQQSETNFLKKIAQQESEIESIRNVLDRKVKNIEEERKTTFLEIEQKDITIINLQKMLEIEKEVNLKLQEGSTKKNIKPEVSKLESRFREINIEKSQLYNQLWLVKKESDEKDMLICNYQNKIQKLEQFIAQQKEKTARCSSMSKRNQLQRAPIIDRNALQHKILTSETRIMKTIKGGGGNTTQFYVNNNQFVKDTERLDHFIKQNNEEKPGSMRQVFQGLWNSFVKSQMIFLF